MFLGEYPVVGTLSFPVLFSRSEYPIGKCNEAFRYGNVDFLRGFLIGFVNGWKPSRVRPCFPLCPDFNRSVFVLLGRVDKEESFGIIDCYAPFFSYFFGLGSIFDINSIFFSSLVSLIQLDGELIIGVFVRKGTANVSFLIAEVHTMDKHCLGIQDQRVGWIEIR